jgi:hypothetical protein
MQSDLIVEVGNDHIVVALSGTLFRALHTKSGQSEWAKLVQLPMVLSENSARVGPSEFVKTALEAAKVSANHESLVDCFPWTGLIARAAADSSQPGQGRPQTIETPHICRHSATAQCFYNRLGDAHKLDFGTLYGFPNPWGDKHHAQKTTWRGTDCLRLALEPLFRAPSYPLYKQHRQPF